MYDGVTYSPEDLTQLLPGIPYNLPFDRYNEMFDLSVKDDITRVQVPQWNNWQDHYKILQDSYAFFRDLGDTYRMKIEWNGSVLTVSAGENGGSKLTKVYEGTWAKIGATNRLHLQSHWGSGVEFSNIEISTP